jgi:hypothetical protein
MADCSIQIQSEVYEWEYRFKLKDSPGKCDSYFILYFFHQTGPITWHSFDPIIPDQRVPQGTTYHITYYATDSVVSKQQVDSILPCRWIVRFLCMLFH